MTKTRSGNGDDPIHQRNERAKRIAATRPAEVTDALASPTVPQVLNQAAAVFEAKEKSEHADQLRRVVENAAALASAFGTAKLPGWSNIINAALSFGEGDHVPSVSTLPAEAARQLSDIVTDTRQRSRTAVLTEATTTPAGGGLSALTVAVEAASLSEPTKPFRPTRRASLPRLHRVTVDDTHTLPGSGAPATLPEFGAITTQTPQRALPAFAVTAGCPSWLLWVYDQAGGESLSQGHGAPWSLRLFIGAMLHLKVSDRDGQWHTLPIPTEEVERWLHPNGWLNRRRDWNRLPEALDAMRELAYVPVQGLGSVLMLAPSVIPRERTDPVVEFTIRIPPSAANGARLDWPRLCRYGVHSAPLYRAYLSVAAALDHVAFKGAPITRQIGKPVVDDEGRPKRGKDGRIRRMRDVLVPHPNGPMAPTLTDHDAARFIGFDGKKRYNRVRARKALEQLAADGVIDLERRGNGTFVLYGPKRNAGV